MKNPVASTPESIAKGRHCTRARAPASATVKGSKGVALPARSSIRARVTSPTASSTRSGKTAKRVVLGDQERSPGTGMVSLVPAAITEEAWTIINYERSFCKRRAATSSLSFKR